MQKKLLGPERWPVSCCPPPPPRCTPASVSKFFTFHFFRRIKVQENCRVSTHTQSAPVGSTTIECCQFAPMAVLFLYVVSGPSSRKGLHGLSGAVLETENTTGGNSSPRDRMVCTEAPDMQPLSSVVDWAFAALGRFAVSHSSFTYQLLD